MSKELDLAISNDLILTVNPFLDAASISIASARDKLARFYQSYGYEYADELDNIEQDLRNIINDIDELRPELRVGAGASRPPRAETPTTPVTPQPGSPPVGSGDAPGAGQPDQTPEPEPPAPAPEPLPEPPTAPDSAPLPPPVTPPDTVTEPDNEVVIPDNPDTEAPEEPIEPEEPASEIEPEEPEQIDLPFADE